MDENLVDSARAVLRHRGTEEQKRLAFPEFFENHNKLFHIICSGRCDLRHLEMMMSRLQDVHSGSMTLETASTSVAGSLNATYIDPVIQPPTPEQAANGKETVVKIVEHR